MRLARPSDPSRSTPRRGRASFESATNQSALSAREVLQRRKLNPVSSVQVIEELEERRATPVAFAGPSNVDGCLQSPSIDRLRGDHLFEGHRPVGWRGEVSDYPPSREVFGHVRSNAETVLHEPRWTPRSAEFPGRHTCRADRQVSSELFRMATSIMPYRIGHVEEWSRPESSGATPKRRGRGVARICGRTREQPSSCSSHCRTQPRGRRISCWIEPLYVPEVRERRISSGHGRKPHPVLCHRPQPGARDDR
ncbi:MAG: hypothetical protein K0R81_182 [Microbacterium sp.]|nr:hypothetical protein [Microbacterium sp.]